MVMISSEEVFTDIITRNRKNSFHFISKGKNGLQKAIWHRGVNPVYNTF